ncbi:restriction endonuclease subunit S [Algoriphagus yeomjeoni]|uniref:Type I restriction enzyme S subunit n=1 Tax=Algoriphagus yeomjeoni TaxID=291403 RepID=A0A327P0A9_9BACT|nr:restriction endonuclease subunit S [Algoriphagus yeomjeoni]RAI84362.1 type I restriction enzyme S subunit [Algoriphagus yeomjeoni]
MSKAFEYQILGEVCKVINGRAYKQEELLKQGKYRVLRVGNFFSNNSWYYSNLELDEDKYCENGDLLFAWSASFGPKIWKGEKVIYHYHIWKLLPNTNKINKIFLYYYLFQRTNSMIGSTHGSIMLHITKGFMESLPVQIPNLVRQKKIASILSALDDKIELNNRINAELEAMAKLIYEYWFVQFDFPFDFAQGKPDSDGKPYKSSGGKMVWNKELKREIPEGWEVKELGRVLKTYLGGTPSTKIEEYWNGDVPWLNSGEISDFPIISSEKKISKKAIKNSPTSFLEKGSVLLSITRHLRVSILGIDACFNQSVVGIKENEQFKNSYIYFSVLSDIDRLMSLRTGAQQPHINKEIVDCSPFVIPGQEVLTLFYEKVEPIIQRIINMIIRNHTSMDKLKQ